MAVTIPIVFTDNADAALAEARRYTDGVKAELSEVEAVSRGAVGALESVGAEAGAAGDAAARTAESVEQLARFEKIERATGAIGDFKDSILQTAPALLGMSEEVATLVGKAGDLAEKGAALGGTFFGPLGAGAGALIGGAFGLLAGVFEEQAAAEKKAAEEAVALEGRLASLRAENAALSESFRRSAGSDLPGILEGLRALGEAAEETESKLRAAKEGAAELSQRLYLTQLEAAEETGRAFELLKGGILDTLKTALDAEAPGGARSLAQLREASEDATAELKRAKSGLSDLYKAIEDAPGTAGTSLGALGLGGLSDAAQEVQRLQHVVSRAAETIRSTDAEIKSRTASARSDAATAKVEAAAAVDEMDEFRLKVGDLDRALAYTREAAQISEAVAEADAGRSADAYAERLRAEEGIFFDSLARRAEALRVNEENTRREFEVTASMYASLLGPVEDVVSEVFGTMASNIEEGISAFEQLGPSTRKAIGEALKSIGGRFRAEAFGEFAAGLASLATPGLRKDAPGHFAASAAYGAAATAAGVTGALASGRAQRSLDSSASRDDERPSVARNTIAAQQGLAPVVVQFQSIVPASQQQAQDAARVISGILEAGRGVGVGL